MMARRNIGNVIAGISQRIMAWQRLQVVPDQRIVDGSRGHGMPACKYFEQGGFAGAGLTGDEQVLRRIDAQIQATEKEQVPTPDVNVLQRYNRLVQSDGIRDYSC